MITPITSLEQQLAALKLSMEPKKIPTIQPSTDASVSKDEIYIMIKELLADELSKIGKLESNVNTKAEPITLEDALAKVLTGDDQSWLMNPDNVKKMPEFIVSDSGKLITQQFIKEFRSLYGN
jgi:hypothetical protein